MADQCNHEPAEFRVTDGHSQWFHDGVLATAPGVFRVRLCRLCRGLYWEPDEPTVDGVRGEVSGG